MTVFMMGDRGRGIVDGRRKTEDRREPTIEDRGRKWRMKTCLEFIEGIKMVMTRQAILRV
jgi:hypothetical protein